MAVRERLEYDVTVTGAREGERDISRVDRAIEGLSKTQADAVRSSKEFGAAQERARAAAVAARKADLDLESAREKLAKATKAGGGSEKDRARALLAVEAAEVKAARAARASSVAHAGQTREFKKAVTAGRDLERQSTRSAKALNIIGKAGYGIGRTLGAGMTGASKTLNAVRIGVGGIAKTIAVGIPVVGGLAAGIGILGFKLFGAATQLEQMDRKARGVFGKTFPEVAKWSQTVATRAGLTTREMTGLAASFADMLQPMGATISQSAKMAERFAQMAPILAEWSGGQLSVSDTSEALMGALTGEYDTLQRLGIPISAAIVQAEALKETHKKNADQVTALESAQAALNIVYAGSKNAVKNYADGAGTLAAKQAQATAKLKEAGQAILVGLLPAFSKAADFVIGHEDDLINWAFHAAAGVIEFGKTTALTFADIIEAVGGLSGTLGRFVQSTLGGFARIGKGQGLLSKILGFSLSGPAKAAQKSLGDMAEAAGADLAQVEESAKKTADGIRGTVPGAADAAKKKLEQMRRAALNIPNKTLTQIQVDEEKARRNVVDIRRRLTDKELTKTRRAKLEADLKKWQTQLAEIRRQKKEIQRSIVVPTGARGLPSTVRVRRLTDKNGIVVGIVVGGGGTAVRGHATGGPISGPGTSTSDSIPAMLSSGEHVWTAKEVQGAGGHSAVERIRKSAAAGQVPGFAAGGPVNLGGVATRRSIRSGMQAAADAGMRTAALSTLADALKREGAGFGNLAGALAFARGQAGKPYIWGGVGPRGYDCSGFQSAITNVALGQNPYSRRFATGSFPAAGWAPGPGAYMVGFFRGNPGHMAGTLLGTNVESRGGDGVVIGRAARGARDAMFGGNIYHLVGSGGRRGGSDPAFDASPKARRQVAMAGGGVLYEPVVGVGTRTGTGYTLAENGPESVTPLGAGLSSRDVEDGFYRALSRAAKDQNAVAMLLADLVAGPLLDAAGVGSRR